MDSERMEVTTDVDSTTSALDDSIEMDMGAVIYGQQGSVNNLDFHRKGRWLLMSTDESAIHIIDSVIGEEKKKLYVKSSGAGIVKFTHHESSILISGDNNKNDYDIKYLSIYDNRYLKKFSYHKNTITSLSMSPLDDNFLTASADKTVLLWNLNQSKPIGKLNLPIRSENIIVNYDPTGVIFGVMCYDYYKKMNTLKLFDARNYGDGPFEEILPEKSILEKAILNSNPDWNKDQIQSKIMTSWNSFEFSNDGNNILINTNNEILFILDGFKSDVEPMVINRKNDSNLTLGSCISPDSKYIITANDDNEVLIYDYKNTNNNIKLRGVLTGHVSAPGCIRHNPQYNEIASGCVNTVLWIPKVII